MVGTNCFTNTIFHLLGSVSDTKTKARLLSVFSSESGVWLSTLPVPSLGTKLDNESLMIVLGLRLGVPIVVKHTCVCGSKVDVFGTHGLCCRRSGGCIPRHAAVNETIRRALVSGGVPAVLEPVSVCRNDGKRPDGMSLIPWSQGLPLLWDFTCSDTLAPFNLPTSASGASRLASSAESANSRKYSSLIPSFHFSPLCVETLGAWGSCAHLLARRIGSRVMEQSGDNRATQFLIQKVTIDVQRGNAASVLATIPSSQDWAEFECLLLIYSFI